MIIQKEVISTEINELKEKLIRASECKYPDTFPCVIVQNKIDLLPKEQQSNDSILKSFAKENGYINAYNVSAKEGINIDKVMDDLIIINIINISIL